MNIDRPGSSRVRHDVSAGAGAPEIHIDAALIASKLGLSTTDFRQQMATGHVAVLCERGTGEDVGHFRATFYYGKRRVRLVVDAAGRPIEAADAGSEP